MARALPFLPRFLVLLLGLPVAAGPGRVPAGPPPVLVELFTSEGCSSCPPADALLAELQRAHTPAGAEVIVLGEHVDYWNRLGWADPFSAPSFSQRQQDYARSLREASVYTPQAIVDGVRAVVGSDRGEVWQAITAAAARAKAGIDLAPAQAHPPGDPGSVSVRIQVHGLRAAGAAGPVVLYLAVTEDGLESRVTRGENAGRRLRHVAVARRLAQLAVLDPGADTFAGSFRIPLDPAWKRQALRAVAFLQTKDGGRILGAAASASFAWLSGSNAVQSPWERRC